MSLPSQGVYLWSLMDPKEQELMQKLRNWCARQERCRSELKLKLYKLKAPSELQDRMQNNLEKEGYMSETRFAEVFAQGKSRIKGWGPMKIAAELRGRGVSQDLIIEALGHLDQAESEMILDRTTEKKWGNLADKEPADRKLKTLRFLVSKGYGHAESKAAVERLLSDEK